MRLRWNRTSAICALFTASMIASCQLTGPDGNGSRLGQITVDGRDRTFRVYAPSETSASPRPLILVFHGLGGTGVQMESLTQLNGVADYAGLVVVYPDAEARTGGQWAMDCPRCTGADTLGINDLAFVDALIQRLRADHNIDPQRVYAVGFSLGAYMTHVLACKRPSTFAAVAPVAGHMNNLLANACPPPVRSIPVLEISGLADPVMPWNGASYTTHTIFSADSSASFWAARNGCLGAPTDSLVEGVSIAGPVRLRTWGSCEAEVQRWGIPGLPHTWPLGSTYGSLGIARFLLRFRRD